MTMRSRGTGPRATIKNARVTVGRGPVPRQRWRAMLCRSGSPAPDPFVIRRSQTTVGEHIGTMEIAGDRPPRYGGGRFFCGTIAGDRPPRYGGGRFFCGTIAGDRPPRYGKKRHFTVGRGPVPRQRRRARLCRSGAPAPDPFGSGRSRTTEVGPMRASSLF